MSYGDSLNWSGDASSSSSALNAELYVVQVKWKRDQTKKGSECRFYIDPGRFAHQVAEDFANAWNVQNPHTFQAHHDKNDPVRNCRVWFEGAVEEFGLYLENNGPGSIVLIEHGNPPTEIPIFDKLLVFRA